MRYCGRIPGLTETETYIPSFRKRVARKYKPFTRMLGESHVFRNDSNAERALSSLYVQVFTDNLFAIANSISKYPSYHLWKKKPSCLQTVFGLRVYKPLVGLYAVMTRKGETPWFIKYDDKIMTLCHGNTFRLPTLCAGHPPVTTKGQLCGALCFICC